MMKSFDARMAGQGGTFVPNNHGCKGGTFASMAFTPEIAEEEERLAGRQRYIPIEDIPNAPEEFSERPLFVTMPGTLEETLAKLLAVSPRWALTVYQKARTEGNLKVLVTLPKVVRELVANGIYSAQVFQMTPDGSGSCYRAFKMFGKECPIAREIFGDIKIRH
jgi:hypothetical protein